MPTGYTAGVGDGMSNAPPVGTPAGTMHWLHRPTGEPNWMVATWTGDGWNLMDGRRRPHTPRELVWWNYCELATPPAVPSSKASAP